MNVARIRIISLRKDTYMLAEFRTKLINALQGNKIATFGVFFFTGKKLFASLLDKVYKLIHNSTEVGH